MKVRTINGYDYRLPNELNDFQLSIYVHLINWKWRNVTTEPGSHKHKGQTLMYDAILPQEDIPHIYPGIRRDFKAHHERNPFRIHRHFYHMSSSQAANINLFLPILHHRLTNNIFRYLRPDFASLATDQLDQGYCLEFWGGNFSVNSTSKGLLGDKTTRAGTDADIAIAYRNHQDELCLWLIEHKLSEQEFTTCGGYRSKGRKDKLRHDCTKDFNQVLADKKVCYYHDQCGYKYWDITDRHRNFFVNQNGYSQCPFKGGMNQLWRNQLLGLAIEDKGDVFKHAYFSVVHHPGNTSLNATLNKYKELIENNPKFSVFTSADILKAVEVSNDKLISEWVDWYRELYKL